MPNERVFRPLHDKVLVRQREAEERTAGGIIVPETSQVPTSIGTIIAIGPGVPLPDGTNRPVSVSEGQEVIYAKYGGTSIEVDGETLVLIAERDIHGAYFDA